MADIKTVLTNDHIIDDAWNNNMEDHHGEIPDKVIEFARAIEAAVLSANAGRVDAGLYLDEQSKVFYALMDDLRFANDIRKVEDAEIIWDAAIAFYKSHAAPTQQASDAGRQG